MKPHPVARLCRKILACRGIRALTPDSWYLRALFRVKVGKKLNLREPQTFSDKLQWLKLHDRNPLYPTLVDKYEVRKYIASKIGADYLPTLVGGPWNSVDEIDFDALPNAFALKCTHDSGGIVLCRDKSQFDVDAARKKLRRAMRRNWYWAAREAPYRTVKPRIIAEEFLSEEGRVGVRDFKFFTFNGKVRMVDVCTRRFSKEGLHITFYDADWNKLPFKYEGDRVEEVAQPRPEEFDKLVALSETLADALPFIRVDFYLPRGRICVGELTLYPGAGLEVVDPPEWDVILGSWLDLSGVGGAAPDADSLS